MFHDQANKTRLLYVDENNSQRDRDLVDGKVSTVIAENNSPIYPETSRFLDLIAQIFILDQIKNSTLSVFFRLTLISETLQRVEKVFHEEKSKRWKFLS